MKRAYADTPAGQIHYRTQGEGEVLLLLHQSPQSSIMFEKAIPIFAQHYRTIAMDTPGYGDSDKPAQPMKISDYADCVAVFLDSLGINEVNAIGHHSGGAIAIEFSGSYPARVAKLVVCGVPYWAPEERAHMAKAQPPPPQLKEDGSHLIMIWEQAKRLNPWAGPELWQRHVLQVLKAGNYINSAFNAVFQYDMASRLPLLKCPTLIMCGDQDVLYKANAQVLPMIPRAREVVITGAGGLVVDQKTKEYTKSVLEFLANPDV